MPKSSPTPFIDSANETYNEHLSKGRYDKAYDLKESVFEDTGVELQCDNCDGAGKINTDLGFFPCHCVLGRDEEDYSNSTLDTYGE